MKKSLVENNLRDQNAVCPITGQSREEKKVIFLEQYRIILISHL